jgi:hypothetical protein
MSATLTTGVPLRPIGASLIFGPSRLIHVLSVDIIFVICAVLSLGTTFVASVARKMFQEQHSRGYTGLTLSSYKFS